MKSWRVVVVAAFVIPVIIAVIGATAGLASGKAKPKIAGDYDVKFTAVANTCGESGIALGTEILTMTLKGKALVGAVGNVLPLMKGTLKEAGRFEIATKRGKSPIEGLKGEFRMTGAIADGKADVVLVARYFMGSSPHCEQSWNGMGAKKQ